MTNKIILLVLILSLASCQSPDNPSSECADITGQWKGNIDSFSMQMDAYTNICSLSGTLRWIIGDPEYIYKIGDGSLLRGDSIFINIVSYNSGNLLATMKAKMVADTIRGTYEKKSDDFGFKDNGFWIVTRIQ